MSRDPLATRTFTAPDPEAVLISMRRILSERTAWDELPELGMLYLTGPDSVELKALPFPADKWVEAGDPKRVLWGLHFMLTKPRGLGMVRASHNMRLMLPDSFCGMFLRNEGWAPPERRAEELYRADLEGKKRPRFKDLPGRREMRMGSAVDCEGRRYMALQQRGTHGVEATYQGQGGGGDEVGGEIPDLLWKLVQAFTSPLGGHVPDTIPDTFTSGQKGPTP